MPCFLPKITCEEKASLLRRHAAAESDYHRAIHELSLSLQSLQKLDGYILEDFADSARKMVEDAWDALERHTTEHGC